MAALFFYVPKTFHVAAIEFRAVVAERRGAYGRRLGGFWSG